MIYDMPFIEIHRDVKTCTVCENVQYIYFRCGINLIILSYPNNSGFPMSIIYL
jgi:hypothetical protein